MRPIEPGCLAIVVDSLTCRVMDTGKRGRVREPGAFLGMQVRVVSMTTQRQCDCCVVVDFDALLVPGSVVTRRENLMRIDDDSDVKQEEQGDVLEVVT